MSFVEPTSASPPAASSDDERADRVSLAVYEFIQRRLRGENIDPHSYCDDFPDLTPQLPDALAGALVTLKTAMEAERVGPLGSTGSNEPNDSSESARPPAIKGYRIVRRIDSGAQATVYQAIQESTGQFVAIKIVSGFTRNSIVRFEREASVLAGLTHDGIVRIRDRGRTAEDAYFLVLDFVRGHDLDEWLSRRPRGAQTQREIVRLFAAMARAIGTAHTQKIIHRDLKPSNILIDEHGQPRIVDFGLAQLIGGGAGDSARQVTATGNIVGSIPWSSPEQVRAETSTLSPSTDVYSLGVLLYRALTGAFPYAVDGPIYRVSKNICFATPPNPSGFRREKHSRIDKSLSHIVLKCLAKRSEERFVSGVELADALEAYSEGAFRIPRRRRSASKMLIAATAIATSAWAITRHPNRVKNETIEETVISLPAYTNSIGMQFVQVPAGGFQMGSTIGEPGHESFENWHFVNLTHSFFVARMEVTRGQYERVMGSLPSGLDIGSSDLPVDQVNWQASNEFCHALSQIDHRSYRLPTEAEWEYACRAGTSTPFAGGVVLTEGWFDQNSGSHLHAVGLKSPNRWGIYDMHGNVAEWTSDRYVLALGHANVTDPQYPDLATLHVIRGGNVFDPAVKCRSAARSAADTDERRAGIGFRVIFDSITPSEE